MAEKTPLIVRLTPELRKAMDRVKKIHGTPYQLQTHRALEAYTEKTLKRAK